jgi:hypothetical protein
MRPWVQSQYQKRKDQKTKQKNPTQNKTTTDPSKARNVISLPTSFVLKDGGEDLFRLPPLLCCKREARPKSLEFRGNFRS